MKPRIKFYSDGTIFKGVLSDLSNWNSQEILQLYNYIYVNGLL